MPAALDTSYTTFPSFNSQRIKSLPNSGILSKHISQKDLDLFNDSGDMASAASPGPYIKNEPDDLQFHPDRYPGQAGFDMSPQFDGQNFSNAQGDIGSVNPSELTMSGSFMNNQFGSHNMSSSFIMGNSNIADDELLELGNLDEPQIQSNGFENYGDQGSVPQQPHGYMNGSTNGGPVSNNIQAASVNQIYSHTPEGAPIQSPFTQEFNYSQFQPMHPQRPSYPQMQNPYELNARQVAMRRQGSDSRSPMTPKTPAKGGVHLGTPDSSSFSSQPMLVNQLNRGHHKSISGQWDNTPCSSNSWLDSPGQSPHSGSMHRPQISELLASGKHASLPVKAGGGIHGAHSTSVPAAVQSQDAKKRRRRESHNLVERRRRDNINERIQDLSKLVPQHRLEDEKVRKHINSTGPLSPSITASGMSPPQATSLLAGGTGRRAAGNITQGLPVDDKDKGPNKGDILNGAVSWTRDLMWLLYQKLEQEETLIGIIEGLGGNSPIQITEDERRMRTELVDAVLKNDPNQFHYSRYSGSGLRVPKHTNLSGDPVDVNPLSPSLSPALQSTGSCGNSISNGQNFWINNHSGDSSGRGSLSFKEEDEYNMDMT